MSAEAQKQMLYVAVTTGTELSLRRFARYLPEGRVGPLVSRYADDELPHLQFDSMKALVDHHQRLHDALGAYGTGNFRGRLAVGIGAEAMASLVEIENTLHTDRSRIVRVAVLEGFAKHRQAERYVL